MIIKRFFFGYVLLASVQLAQGCLTPYGACITSGGDGGNVELCIEQTFNTQNDPLSSGQHNEKQAGYSIQTIYQTAGPLNEEMISALNDNDDYSVFMALEKRPRCVFTSSMYFAFSVSLAASRIW